MKKNAIFATYEQYILKCEYRCYLSVIYRLLAIHIPGRGTSALSQLQIGVDWPETGQMQGVSGENRVRRPIEPLRRRRWPVSGQPCERGPGGRGLCRSSSAYEPIRDPPRFAPTAPLALRQPQFVAVTEHSPNAAAATRLGARIPALRPGTQSPAQDTGDINIAA